MKKIYYYLLSGLVAAASAIPSVPTRAQSSDGQAPPMYLRKPERMKSSERVDIKHKYPLIAKILKLRTDASPFRKAVTALPRVSADARRAPMLRAEGTGRELWGNLVYQSGWTSATAKYGLYSFRAQSPATFTSFLENQQMKASGGAALLGETYHSMEFNTDFISLGIVKLWHTAYDTTTGEMIGKRTEVDDMSMTASETAVDDATGTVWGEFFSSDFKTLELGAADYESMTRTTVGTLTKTYVAMGITKAGKLYGIASDGKLYIIDKTTAKETAVGPTGLTLANSDGEYYGQSGEIDQTNDTFYWAAIDINGNAGLYTVDLATGAASKVADFTTEEQVYGLCIPKAAAADGAPAKANDLSVYFKDGSRNGYFRFQAPTKTYGGQDIGSNTWLNYTVYLNGEEIGTSMTKAGGRGNVTLTDVPEGLNKFSVVFSNDAGKGPTAAMQAYIGFDTPEKVGSLTFDYDKSSGKASLKWNTPAQGLNGGYIGGLKYDVVRYPDGKKVAEAIGDTTFSETFEADAALVAYSYGVTAINGSKRSEEARTAAKTVGSYVVPPYLEEFGDKSSMEAFTVVNANGDSKTWNYSSMYQAVYYSYDKKNDADDWLVTPEIRVKAGKVYNVSFKAWSSYSSYPERIEVKLGADTTASALTTVVVEPTTVTNETAVLSGSFSVDKDQSVFIGLHAISDKYMGQLYVDSISVSEGKATSTPAAPSELAVEPDPQGALKAKVSLTAPSTDFAGNALASLEKVELMRNDSLIHTFDKPAPGAKLSFDDTVDKAGKYKYTAVAFNSEGEGQTTTALTAYVGEDIPMYPTGIKVTDKLSSVSFAWDKTPATGTNGGVVIPEKVKYSLYTLTEDEYGYVALGNLIGQTSSSSLDLPIKTTEGEQDLVQFGMNASNTVGTSEAVLTPAIITGKAYGLPFHESFPGKKSSYGLWWTSYKGNSRFTLSDTETFDGDGGSAVFSAVASNDSSSLISGKISLAGATRPTLVFGNAVTQAGGDVTLSVMIRKPDGTSDKVSEINYKDINIGAGWHVNKVDLTKYVSLPYIMVEFLATAGETGTDIPLYVDNIVVTDLLDDDLELSLPSPVKSVAKGSRAKVSVKVQNVGANAAKDFTVKLFAGDELVDQETENNTLTSFSKMTYTFDYAPSVFSKESEAELKAEIVYEADKNSANNTATMTVALTDATLPAPEALTAKNEEGAVKLEWNAPSTLEETLTESFEDYNSWSKDAFGDWTTIDGDGGMMQQLFSDNAYPGQGEQAAYLLFEPDDFISGITSQYPEFAAHSGKKYLASIYSATESGFVANDDWLISPELTGKKQTITFWVSNLNGTSATYPETFKVLASSSGTAREDFKQIGEDHTTVKQTWEMISVELPEGTKHFAIQNCTDEDNSFFFMLDDITYTAGMAAPTTYNVYRDGTKIDYTEDAATTFTDIEAKDGTHVYSVTAVYPNGESMPVSVTVDVATGIKSLNADGAASFDVHTLDGKLVGRDLRSLDLLQPGVYIVNGKKTTVE